MVFKYIMFLNFEKGNKKKHPPPHTQSVCKYQHPETHKIINIRKCSNISLKPYFLMYIIAP